MTTHYIMLVVMFSETEKSGEETIAQNNTITLQHEDQNNCRVNKMDYNRCHSETEYAREETFAKQDTFVTTFTMGWAQTLTGIGNQNNYL